MSHRTEELKPLTGLPHLIREMRYHEAARQALAVVLILLYTLVAAPTPLLVSVGFPIALIGTLVRLFASGYILKNEELARSGPYALVRHPLYTGNILLIIGFSVASGRIWAVPLALIFFWFYYPTAIEYEDRKLRRYFGQAWDEWAAETPALLPRFRARGATGGRWSLTRSLKNNGEVIIVIYVLICAYFVMARIL
jgi:protein-S-isoprenylcysteine O-methyltransferase Ste14